MSLEQLLAWQAAKVRREQGGGESHCLLAIVYIYCVGGRQCCLASGKSEAGTGRRSVSLPDGYYICVGYNSLYYWNFPFLNFCFKSKFLLGPRGEPTEKPNCGQLNR